MVLAVAINRDHKIFGHELAGLPQKMNEAVTWKADGTMIVATKEIAKDIKGYGGSTPLEIIVRSGRVTGIKALKNAETPEFFSQIAEGGMLDRWKGMTLEEARTAEVDGVSGATLSSDAVIATVRRRAELAAAQGGAVPVGTYSLADVRKIWASPKFLCALLVVIAGCILPLFVRSRRFRMVQLALNVLVLGLWSGTFLSYSLMVNYLSNGVNLIVTIIPLLLLTVAFLFRCSAERGIIVHGYAR